MPYQNNNFGGNNSQFQQIHVTSNGLTLFSGDTMLRVSLYDQSLSLSFTPAVTDPSTGQRKFPKENAINFLLTASRVAAMYSIMNNRTAPAIVNHVARKDSLTCNRDGSNLLAIVVSPEGQVSLIGYAGIGEDRIPKKTIQFDFEQAVPLLDFNPETGEFKVDETPIQVHLILFITMLQGFLSNILGADSHFGKYNARYTNQRVMSTVDAMATKLGVPTTAAPSYNSNVPGTNVSPGGMGNGMPGGPVPTTMVTDLSGMLGDDPLAFAV